MKISERLLLLAFKYPVVQESTAFLLFSAALQALFDARMPVIGRSYFLCVTIFFVMFSALHRHID